MAAPPSPPYPKNCGKSWNRTKVVTGELYGKGGFGRDFQARLSPLAFTAELANIGRSRGRQQDLQAKVQDLIDQLEVKITQASGGTGKRRLLTSKQEESLRWLLGHAKANLGGVDTIWNRWVNRFGGTFPLNLDDRLTNIPGAGTNCANKFGQWVDSSDPRVDRILCPTREELEQRPRDRAAIKERLEWALECVRCAEVGMNRILLYKRALAEFKNQDLPELQTPPGESPSVTLPDVSIALPTRDDDLCSEMGIACPPGEEPSNPEANPDDWDPDPDGLPDPDDLPDGDIGPTLPPDRKPKPKSAWKPEVAGLAIAGGIAGLVVLYKVFGPK